MADFITVCPASEIPDGAREVFDIKGHWIAIFNVGDRYYAIEDICSHDEGTLSEDEDGNPVPLDGYEIECPRHGARFDIRNGEVKSPPAMVDIPFYEVRVRDGNLELAI